MSMSDDGGGPDRLAPVIPLFGGGAPAAGEEVATPRGPFFREIDSTPTAAAASIFDPFDVAADLDDGESLPTTAAAPVLSAEEVRARAEEVLLKKLRARSLSVVEARRVLAQSGLDAAESEALVEDFSRRGYLDDRALAEQLVHSGATRRGMGRQAVRQLLQKRMVAREVIDETIAELPDDDAARAAEFADTKARALLRLDDETAIRRLTGQLARRGFGGSVAAVAARTALARARAESGGGVRFR